MSANSDEIGNWDSIDLRKDPSNISNGSPKSGMNSLLADRDLEYAKMEEKNSKKKKVTRAEIIDEEDSSQESD